MIIHDDIFAWEGWGGKLRLGSGRCRLRIFDLRRKEGEKLAHLRPIIVVVSDVPDSPMSIRSCSGHIATSVTREFAIDPARMIFMEYYQPKTYGENDEHLIPERFEIVEFTWHEGRAFNPKYRALNPPLKDAILPLLRETDGRDRSPV
jgi:hypothetical protein